MHFLRHCTTYCLALSFVVSRASGYFLITEPTSNTRWIVGTPASVSWRKGVDDGVSVFDIEIARLNHDGLIFVAKNVPTSPSSLNILVEDFPAGDDYFVLFLNSTHGVMHATSPRFSIVTTGSASSGVSSAQQPSAVSGVQTVTVSGTPNPTKQFATTLAAFQNGASSFLTLGTTSLTLWCWTMVTSCFIGFVWTLL